MSKYPLVSVIIPTFNRPDFLKKTIQSIIDQTYRNLEIIVVSNCFSSVNKETVLNFNDSRTIYFDQENSGGPSSPRNHGIRVAKGQYIAFCDDDDLFMPDKIAKQVDALEHNVDFGVCYTKMLRFNNEREWSNFHEEGAADFKSLLLKNTVPISSVIIKKDLLDKFGGFEESHKVGTAEDFEFILKMSYVAKLLFIDEYLIKYWSGDNRTTSNQHSVKEIFNYFGYVLFCLKSVRRKVEYPVCYVIYSLLHHTLVVLKILLYDVFKRLNSLWKKILKQ